MSIPFPSSGTLAEIKEKVFAGERLSREDGILLMTSDDLLTVGALADCKRSEKSGDRVFYSTNLNLNPTNVCVLNCKFCAFSRKPGDKEAYVVQVEEALKRVASRDIGEVHMVGGIHPHLSLSFYEDLIKAIRNARPDIYIHAFTAVEIDFLSKHEKITVGEVLSRLVQAGINSLPGGGAEIFSPRVRKILCPSKLSGERWLTIMEIAHRMGIPSNATMLYGHLETAEERVDHLLALRELQDKTGGFLTFVPLAFQPARTQLGESLFHSSHDSQSGFDDLKVCAVSRLILDNFRHIKALWPYLGIKLAQTSLFFGVDDLGGISLDEQISSSAGGPKGSVDRATLEELIRQAGRVPVHSNSGRNGVNRTAERQKQEPRHGGERGL